MIEQIATAPSEIGELPSGTGDEYSDTVTFLSGGFDNSHMKLIIVDDSKEYMSLVRRLLAREMPDIEVTEYDPEQQGEPSPDFDWSIYDVLILDYQLGSSTTGIDWLTRYRHVAGFPPAIMMTGEGDEYVAARAIKAGAHDFIRKADITAERLLSAASRASPARGSYSRKRPSTFQ